jgi:hypothetical protein
MFRYVIASVAIVMSFCLLTTVFVDNPGVKACRFVERLFRKFIK